MKNVRVPDILKTYSMPTFTYSSARKNKQYRQYTYQATLSRVRITIFAVVK